MWASGLSYQRVVDALAKEGVYNKATGKPFSSSAAQKAAMNHMLHNLEQSKKEFSYRQSVRGQVVTDEEWQGYVAQMTKLFFCGRPNAMRKYIAQHGIQHYFKA